MLWLEDGEDVRETVERFAAEKGMHAAQVFSAGEGGWTGILAPDADGRPGLMFSPGAAGRAAGGNVVVQEMTGINFRRMKDPRSGAETLAQTPSVKTRVMERPAPIPEESGPGTVPVYLFNAEFN